MVTLPGARPPSPIHIQFDHLETGSNAVHSTQPTPAFGFVPSSNFASAPSPQWSSPTSTPMIRNGGLVPNSSENRSNATKEFWKLPNKVPLCRFRAPKRPSAVDSAGSEDVELSPQPKIRITEEKMLARLRNFHITSASDNVDSSWFFMQKPMEMFDDIENRISDEDEDDEKHAAPSRNIIIANADSDISDDDLSEDRRNTLAVASVLKRILEADRKRAATTVAPNPCTDIVLWKPPEDFLKQIVPSNGTETTETLSSMDPSSNHIVDAPMSNAEFTDQQPSASATEKMDSGYMQESAWFQRRFARQYSKPIIDVLNLPMASVTSNSSGTYDSNGCLDSSCMMDIDE